jgi:hypothetical protein
MSDMYDRQRMLGIQGERREKSMGLMDSEIAEHRARKNEADARRMQQVTEHDGQPELWFDATFSIAGIDDIPLPWKGVDHEDAARSFKIWLATVEDPEVDGTIPWHTIKVVVDGAERILTFRGDWVAGFKMKEKGRARA